MIQLRFLLAGLLADPWGQAGAALRRRSGDHPAPRSADRGGVSLEQVVITLGLFLLAGLVVAGITAAVNGRLSLLK